MKENIWIILVLGLLTLNCNSNLKYIERDKPNLKPKKFAPEFISKESEAEFGSVFTKDGKEFFYAVDSDNRAEIRYTTIKDGKWITPKTIISHEKYSYNDPYLSLDEDRLYYISDMPRNIQDTIKDIDIWYSIKEGDKWSKPINIGDKINSNKNEYYISITKKNNLFFASNKNAAKKRDHDFDIYSSKFSKGEFKEPVKLSGSINTKRYEADVYVSPDENYIIFCSARKEGYGKGDLYISFKDENNEWTKSVNMGEEINSENHELCPFVTRDGKYLFYTSNQDIYWISTKILETYK